MTVETPEVPNFIAAVAALGSTHAERAKEFGVVKRTIERMIVQKTVSECYTRLLPHPGIAYALYLDALAWQAKRGTTKKRNGRKSDQS